jgi:hypothetical protein
MIRALASSVWMLAAVGCVQIFGFEPGTVIESGSGAGGNGTVGAGSGAGGGVGGGDVMPTGDTVWSRSFGDGADQYGGGIVVSGDAVTVVGDFLGTLDFGAGVLLNEPDDFDIYVAQLATADGATRWSKGFGDGDEQFAHDAAADATGNVFFTEGMSGQANFGSRILTSAGESDAYVALLDASGNHVWSDNYGDGTSQWGTGVAISASGKLAFTGGYNDFVDFGDGVMGNNGDLDVFVAVFDAPRQLAWQKGFGGPAPDGGEGSDEGMAVAFDSQQNVIVAGYFKNDMSIDGVDLGHSGETDVFVAKFDPNGNVLWAHGYGDGGDDLALGVAVSSTDDIYVVGTFNGTINFGGPNLDSAGTFDAFVLRLTPEGNFAAQMRAGDAEQDVAQSVAVDAKGHVVVLGYFQHTIDWGSPLTGSADGFRDLFIVKLDPDLGQLWGRAWGSDGWQGDWQADDLALDKDGYIYLSATFEGTVDTGVNVHTSQGGRDLLVAKLKP